jgi:hypothetical protein
MVGAAVSGVSGSEIVGGIHEVAAQVEIEREV